MKHSPWSFLLILCLLVGALVAGGCMEDNSIQPDDNQPPAGVTDEKSAMEQMARSDEFVTNDERTFEDEAVQPADYATFGELAVDITPLRFGRFITSISKTVTVTIDSGDTTATAEVSKDIYGIFKIRALSGSGDTILIEKEFHDRALRYIKYRRVANTLERFWRNWVPVATSLVEGGTISPNDRIHITLIEMQIPNHDTITVTDPTSFYLRFGWRPGMHPGVRHRVPELMPGQEVTLRVTLTSSSSDTDYVALRVGFDRFHKRRQRLTLVSEINNGDGTYTRVYQKTWLAHRHGGFFHAGVEAMTYGTVNDDTEPYSVNWWGIPYKVLRPF